MSYQVLARKWRPQSLPDVIGQSAVVRILENSLKNNRLHPFLVFAGPRGTGKTSMARILAKTLNCGFKTNTQACNNCPSCRDIDHSKSLDVMEIDGASHNGVEAVRQLKDSAIYQPTGPFRVYIIDEVHMLSQSAFNALLKILEEPPSHVVFIMATTEIKKIPVTVLSRAQILPFRPIVDQLIYQHLHKICQVEKVKADEQSLWTITREASGSLRDAQGLLDQIITFCDKQFHAEDVSRILGLTQRTYLTDTLKSLLDRDAQKMLKVLNQLHVSGADPALFLQSLIKLIRHSLLLKLNAKDTLSLIPVSNKEKDQLVKWVAPSSCEELQLLFDMAVKGLKQISYIQDTKVFLEMLLLRMCQAPYIEKLFS